MKLPRTATFIPGAIGFLGMAALGWNLAPSPRAISATASPQSGRHNSAKSMSRFERDRATVAAQMHAIRNAGSPAARMRATIALANSIPSSEFGAWTEGDRFDLRQGTELNIFRMILFERWVKEDPDALVTHAATHMYSGQVSRAMAGFADKDPQFLIDHYRAHPDQKAELQTLGSIAKKHPELALQRLQELSRDGFSTDARRLSENLLSNLAKSSPAALEAALEDLPPDLRRTADTALSGQRLATSYATEVRSLWERPDGWRIFSDNMSNDSKLQSRLIGHLAELPDNWKAGIALNPYNVMDSSNGRQWFEADLEGAGFSPSQAQTIRNRALSELASSDLAFALGKLDPDVDRNTRANVIAQAIRSTKGDSAAAEALIDKLGSEEDRQLARNQLDMAGLTSKESRQQPREWLEKLGSASTSADPYSALNQLSTWDKTQIADLRSGFSELPVEPQQNIARAVAAGGLYSQVDPGFAGDAIRSLVLHPRETDSDNHNPNDRTGPVAASSTYAVKLAGSDPAAATTWIGTLPDGDAKLWAQKNVAANWNQYDPQAVSEWVNTLPAQAKEQVTQYLKTRK